MTLRPFNISDATHILGWTDNKTDFRKWSADRYSNYPATPDEMAALYSDSSIHPLTLIDDKGIVVGHVTIRIPDPNIPTSVRLGFVIIDKAMRGKGYGKALMLHTIDYAHKVFKAKNISLGVFINNPSAMRCYLSAGFKITGQEAYTIDGEIWEGVEMVYDT